MPKHILIALLIITTALSACKRRDLADEEKAKVKEPGRDILADNGTLHTFHLDEFLYDKTIDIRKEKTGFSFVNFSPSVTDEEPRFDDEDPTPNWLGYNEESWDEERLQWVSNENPLQLPPYSKTRPYRIIQNGQLQSITNGKYNRPIYENLEENIYERQLAVRFVWDFGSYGEVKTERDLSFDYIDSYETLYGFPFLSHVKTWSKLDYETRQFSQDAKVFAASRSVERDTYVIESVRQNNNYSLNPTQLQSDAESLTQALTPYRSADNLLEYRFIIDYIHEHSLWIRFDLDTQTAFLYDEDKKEIAEASINFDNEQAIAEINTQALSLKQLQALNLPTYFNPIIAGPFNGEVYYGKFYPKTDEFNRLLLTPIFFLNNTAKTDIKNLISRWREQEHTDRWDKVIP